MDEPGPREGGDIRLWIKGESNIAADDGTGRPRRAAPPLGCANLRGGRPEASSFGGDGCWLPVEALSTTIWGAGPEVAVIGCDIPRAETGGCAAGMRTSAESRGSIFAAHGSAPRWALS